MSENQQFALSIVSILVAGFSLCVSAVSLGWNVYRDILLKPRAKVRLSLMTLLHPAFPDRPEFLRLSVTNLGPGQLRIKGTYARKWSFLLKLLRKTKLAFYTPDYRNPAGAQLPFTLEVGEDAGILFPWRVDCLLQEDYTHIGVIDSYGRLHWAPADDITELRSEYEKAFAGQRAGDQ